MFAAEDGNMEVVKLLISAGADVNIRDKVRRLELLIGAVSVLVVPIFMQYGLKQLHTLLMLVATKICLKN